jgi:hypothetical protein
MIRVRARGNNPNGLAQKISGPSLRLPAGIDPHPVEIDTA